MRAHSLTNGRFCLAGFDELWVSTEDKEIAEEALRLEANVHERPQALAEDETASVDAVWEFVDRHPGWFTNFEFDICHVYSIPGNVKTVNVIRYSMLE